MNVIDHRQNGSILNADGLHRLMRHIETNHPETSLERHQDMLVKSIVGILDEAVERFDEAHRLLIPSHILKKTIINNVIQVNRIQAKPELLDEDVMSKDLSDVMEETYFDDEVRKVLGTLENDFIIGLYESEGKREEVISQKLVSIRVPATYELEEVRSISDQLTIVDGQEERLEDQEEGLGITSDIMYQNNKAKTAVLTLAGMIFSTVIMVVVIISYYLRW